MKLEIQGTMLENCRSYGPDVTGFEKVVVLRDGDIVVPGLEHINFFAAYGHWLTTKQLEGLADLWEPHLLAGDRLEVLSYKDRGNNKVSDTADCKWGAAVVLCDLDTEREAEPAVDAPHRFFGPE